jgi:phosphatidylinositol 3-kinase
VPTESRKFGDGFQSTTSRMNATASSSGGRSKDTSLTLVLHSQLTHLPCTFQLNSLELPLNSIIPPITTSLIDNPTSRHTGLNQVLPSDLYCKLQLFSNNNPLTLPIQSSHKSFKSKSTYAWNESIVFPINYSDLPLSAVLVITVYDIAGPRQTSVVGGTTLRLFGKQGTLRKGKQRCYLWPKQEADASVTSETPSKLPAKDEMGKLEKLVKLHERGDLTRMDWLDKLAFRQIEKIHAVRCFILSDNRETEGDCLLRLNQRDRRICSFMLTCLDSISQ